MGKKPFSSFLFLFPLSLRPSQARGPARHAAHSPPPFFPRVAHPLLGPAWRRAAQSPQHPPRRARGLNRRRRHPWWGSPVNRVRPKLPPSFSLSPLPLMHVSFFPVQLVSSSSSTSSPTGTAPSTTASPPAVSPLSPLPLAPSPSHPSPRRPGAPAPATPLPVAWRTRPRWRGPATAPRCARPLPAARCARPARPARHAPLAQPRLARLGSSCPSPRRMASPRSRPHPAQRPLLARRGAPAPARGARCARPACVRPPRVPRPSPCPGAAWSSARCAYGTWP
jgi:hypothetical protein